MRPTGTRTIRLRRPLDLAATLSPIRRGGIDPCMRLWAGECWRATRTPDGPASVHLQQRGDEVVANAWGDGAAWILDHVPDLLGEYDDDHGFDPRVPLVAELARRHPGVRIGRTLAVAEALAPTVVEQRVTSGGAHRSWATLVRWLGEPAPGPAGLRLPPTPATLARTPSWTFHRAD